MKYDEVVLPVRFVSDIEIIDSIDFFFQNIGLTKRSINLLLVI